MKKIIPALLLSLLASGSLFAQNCIPGFQYKMPVTVSNPNSDTLWDYQLKVTFNSAALINNSKMQSNGNDIRFASNCCDVYCHFLVDGTINTTNTEVWVNIPMIPANGTADFFLAYGNSTANDASSGECTFDFFEDFSDSTSYKFTNPCGSLTSTVSGGNLGLSWGSNGLLLADSVFDMNTVFTAEMNVNTASGSWPGLYWAKATSEDSYACLINNSQVRVSVTGGTGFCSGHNWASPLVNYTGVAGIWSNTWINTGDIEITFPTVGTINSTDVTHARDEDLRLLIGGISGGTGAMNIDWIRARKYAASIPSFSFAAEAPTNFDVPPVALSNDTSICSDQSLLLDAGNYSIYDWSTSETTQTINVDTNGNYSVIVTDSVGCMSTDSINLTVNPTPIVSLGTDSVICNGDTVTLDAGIHTSYTWSTSETTQTINATNDATYIVEVTDSLGCTSEDTIVVSISIPSVGITGDSTICNGDSITLDAGNAGTYLWNDNSTSQTNTYSPSSNDTTVYSVVVTDSIGCTSSDSITVYTVECVGFDEYGNEVTVNYFPNPTKGLLNYSIAGMKGKISVQVFSQNGKAVYSGFINTKNTSNGSIDLSGLSKGVYLLVIESNEFKSTNQVILN